MIFNKHESGPANRVDAITNARHNADLDGLSRYVGRGPDASWVVERWPFIDRIGKPAEVVTGKKRSIFDDVDDDGQDPRPHPSIGLLPMGGRL